MKTELYERIKIVANRFAGSETKLAAMLELRQKQLNSYLNATSQRNLWEHLHAVEKLYPEIRREWLWWGEGEMLMGGDKAQPANEHTVQQAPPPSANAIPLLGFASCSTGGWHGTMSIAVAVEPPKWHEGMIAVMASGESMLPAGIGHGQVCYCDTTVAPAVGEAVFVEQVDGSGTIKLFLGRSEQGNGKEYIHLTGWLDKKVGNEPQEPFNLHVLPSHVKRMAPVIYVRRRL